MKEQIKQDHKSVTMKANEKVTLTLSAKNHRGKESPVGNKPVWTTTDGSMVILTPSENGYECTVAGTMKVGKCKVSAEALGSTGQIATTVHFDILSPYADLLEITQGSIVDV